MKRAGLILVDFQNDYFPGGRFPLPHAEAAVKQAGILLELARDKKIPLWHIRHIDNDPDATFFLPNTDGVEFHPIVTPLPHEKVIEKHYPNAFHETSLEKSVRSAGVELLFFCGAMSNMCIDSSVRAAFDLGFTCVVAQDACAASDLEFAGSAHEAKAVHEIFMAALASAYARVENRAEIDFK